VDEVIERYVAWREECEAVRAGYAAWSSRAEGERTIRFAVYNAAVTARSAPGSTRKASGGSADFSRRISNRNHDVCLCNSASGFRASAALPASAQKWWRDDALRPRRRPPARSVDDRLIGNASDPT
jgi:hypothetical protein